MDLVYLGDHRRFSLAKQRAIVETSTFAKKQRIEDKLGDRMQRDWLAGKKLRQGHHDRVLVVELFLLANDGRDLLAAFDAFMDRGAVIEEIVSGRRSDNPKQLAAMMARAKDFHAGRPLPEQLAEWGLEGSKKSSASKRLNGHMPYRDMDKILDDQQRFPYFDQAVAALNAVSREKGYTEISKSWAQRRKREGHLKYRPRISGHSKH